MYSVKNNTTIQEMWNAKPGTTALMSHCAVSPTIMMHQAILGVGQDSTGKWFLRPQLGDLENFTIKSHTPWGPIEFEAILIDGRHWCKLNKASTMPLELRTLAPQNMPFHDRGFEFTHDLTGMAEVTFAVDPYPQNQLIVETKVT